jgi:HEAT repeat protein
MLAIALGNIKDSRAEQVLIPLLRDEEIAGHAIIALGKVGSRNACSAIESFLNHSVAWVRQEARKALSRLRCGL